ncbi:MAG: SDR family NAD(P)-dependent oxidoreductase [Ilumatobacteraceae bacterium]|nr:SDR family NAD(P)-dependent oxidoreductase [Ilumatobacteraceae bacterium]
MNELEGRVAIVTGAGRGLGREHAKLLASHGARVVVNDLGVGADGTGSDHRPADDVVAEISDAGGTAVASHDDVADWDGARKVIDAAIAAFGELDVVINNAGILRDSTIVNMTEHDFDAVVRVHLKGHAAPTKWAATYWREEHKRGATRQRNLVHTSSTSGLYANPGQSNYGSAKSGIATFNQIVAQELAQYGVVSNCVVPGARTRLTLASPGLPEIMEAPAEGFDIWDPANASPLVAFLSSASCRFNGEAFYVQGGTIRRLEPWTLIGDSIEKSTRWDLTELSDAMQAFATTSEVAATQ